MPQLRIATFNVNGIRSRLPHLLQWLAREQPDIACLQELKAVDEGFPRADVEAAGYGAIWQGQRSWNGVAILARGSEPIETRRGLPGDPDDTHSRYIEAVAHGVVVGCLYLPNGNPQPGPKFDYKLRWFERLIEYAATLHAGGHPVVLAGDYNVVPTDELDIYNPRSWRRDALLQPESRECWRRLLGQGWTDALRTLFPDEKIYTFWDYFREHWPRNAGLRIDHLLLSPALAPALTGAGVDRWVRGLEGASDHAPTWIELDPGARRQLKRAKDVVAASSRKKIASKPAAGAAKTTKSSGAAGTAMGVSTAGRLTKKPAKTAKAAAKNTKNTTKKTTNKTTKKTAKKTGKRPARTPTGMARVDADPTVRKRTASASRKPGPKAR